MNVSVDTLWDVFSLFSSLKTLLCVLKDDLRVPSIMFLLNLTMHLHDLSLTCLSSSHESWVSEHP